MQKLPSNPALEILLKRYVWWESTQWASNHPEVFLANLMNIGLWEDIQITRKLLGDKIFISVLKKPPPGYFNYRAWDGTIGI